MKLQFDIVIVGGGVSGSALASSLSKLGYKVAVIERSSLTNFKAGESLSPECKRHFSDLSFQYNETTTSEYYGHISFWGSSVSTSQNFIFNPYGNGFSIDRLAFEKQLLTNAENNGATVFMPAKTTIHHINETCWESMIEQNGNSFYLRSKLVIYATGRGAQGIGGINARKFYDNLVALTIVQNDDRSDFKHLFIESLPDGWFYTNILPGNKRVYSFFTDHDVIPKQKNRKSFFIDRINQSIWAGTYNISESLLNSNMFVSDARTYFSRLQFGPGWFNIGDSAYTIDPLSGQGILKNLKAIEFWNDKIEGFLSDFRTIGLLYTSYNQTNFDNHLMQKMKIYAMEGRWHDCKFWARRRTHNDSQTPHI
jgi:flavin-dependent dehydrogenase